MPLANREHPDQTSPLHRHVSLLEMLVICSFLIKETDMFLDRDHSAGNAAMKQRYRDIRVYGGVGDNVPDITQ